MTTESRYRILKTNESNGYSAVSLFAGAGGMALGLEHAGFSHLLLNEFDRQAAATLHANRPDWPIICRDIRDVDFSHLKGQVDLLEGGFPCQAFSIAGKRLGFRDVRGMMFFEFARAVNEARPKVVVGENVKGLVNHDAGLTLKLMVATLQALGYRVARRILRAQYFDVPQARERLLLVAVRKDVQTQIVLPRERDYTVSVREALAACPASAGVEYPAWKSEVLKLVPEGGNWRDLPESVQRRYLGGDWAAHPAAGTARRLSWSLPSPTLTCQPGERRTERCHPSETRPLTVREYARIQTFPDSWAFEGSARAQYKQIGNAVPVNLGYHLGMAVAAILSRSPADALFEGVDQLPAATRHG